MKTIPGRPGHILGWRFNAFQFHRNPIGYMEDSRRNFGDVAAFEDGKPSPVFAFGPEHNRTILENPDTFQSAGVGIKGPPGSSQQRLAFGIFNLNGDDHQNFRKQVSPDFSTTTVHAHYAKMTEITSSVMDSWETGRLVDLQSLVRRLALELSVRTILGMSDGPTDQRLGHLLERWVATSTSIWCRLIPARIPGLSFDRALRTAELLEKELLALLASEQAKGASPGCPGVLQTLAGIDFPQSGCPYETAQGHLNLLFAAAHDTTASALTWTLFFLAQHPSTAGALREEITGVCGGTPPSLAEIQAFQMLDWVVKESMRVLAPVVFCSRRATEEVVLGDHPIPQGAIVTFSPFLTHRQEDLFPDPNAFTPERWKDARPGPYDYLPYIAGRRRCLGAGFATLSVKVVIAMFIQRFSHVLQEGARIDTKVQVTLRSRQGLPAILSKPGSAGKRVELSGTIRDLCP